MKTFFRDYKELCKHSNRFYKDHWLGTIVMNVAGAAVGLAIVAAPVIKGKVEDKIDEIKNKDK